MATELTMPQMGYDMQQGTLVRWLKSEGASVKKGEPIAEIETDKAVVEFQSYADGVLSKILVKEGTTVEVGKAIAVVGAPGETVADKPSESKKSEETKTEANKPEAQSTRSEEVVSAERSTVDISSSDGDIKVSPVARKLADEMNIDLSQIKGTGPGGRITKDDVVTAGEKGGAKRTEQAPVKEKVSSKPAAEAPKPATLGELIPITKMRQQIARVTVKSKQEIPHYYVSTEVDMTQAMQLRAQLNQSDEFKGTKVSVNDLIVKASVEALKKYPKFNASYTDEGIQIHGSINIGLAMSMEQGLMVPAIMNCDDKTLKELAAASRDLGERAKGGTLRAEEYTGGTFAISNLGMFDVSSFIAVIHPPQAAVLAVGSVTKRPVARGDELTIADMMNVTLSADHRVVDGADGAMFVGEVKRLLQNPFLLLL
ncbi:MAG: dihydrolipoamide acetyltransferase family protein [Chloroflexi bacterium]|nr:dihydrolipoamide acetyltransferase family protein [Chloroflexota bacterium]